MVSSMELTWAASEAGGSLAAAGERVTEELSGETPCHAGADRRQVHPAVFERKQRRAESGKDEQSFQESLRRTHALAYDSRTSGARH